jgi:hypothetical protein
MQSNDVVTLSSPIEQARWSHYLAEAGIVYAAGTRQAPLPMSSLPSHLARAGGPPESRVEDRISELLKFYGAFGFLAPTVRTLPARGRRRPSVRSGESIAWALRHAWNVRAIMELHEARGDELDGLLSALVGERPVRVRRWRGGVGARSAPWITVPRPRESDPLKPFTPQRRRGEPALEFSRRLIAEFLNPNLATVRRTYDAATGSPQFGFDCLIDVVYWQLADALTATNLRRCRCCGTLFFATDPRMLVCPALPPRRESTCGIQYRMRRWRATTNGRLEAP